MDFTRLNEQLIRDQTQVFPTGEEIRQQLGPDCYGVDLRTGRGRQKWRGPPAGGERNRRFLAPGRDPVRAAPIGMGRVLPEAPNRAPAGPGHCYHTGHA